MVLELRLNLQAFYRHCAHFAFDVPSLVAWSQIAIKEYEYAAHHASVDTLGLTSFDPEDVAEPLGKDRAIWKNNFVVLTDRLTELSVGGGFKDSLWMDIYALQLMYSEHEQPVFIAPVYGTILHNVPEKNLKYPPACSRSRSPKTYSGSW
jgi:hypothetical protein